MTQLTFWCDFRPYDKQKQPLPRFIKIVAGVRFRLERSAIGVPKAPILGNSEAAVATPEPCLVTLIGLPGKTFGGGLPSNPKPVLIFSEGKEYGYSKEVDI